MSKPGRPDLYLDRLPRRRMGSFGTGLLAAGLALAACTGGGDAAPVSTPTPSLMQTGPAARSANGCTAENIDRWHPAPPAEVDYIADKLRISLEAAAVSIVGYAACVPGVPIEDIANGNLVTILDMPSSWAGSISDHCLLVGSNVKPVPGAVASHVGVVCPLILGPSGQIATAGT